MAVYIVKLRPRKRLHYLTNKAKWSEHYKNADSQCCLGHAQDHIDEISASEDFGVDVLAIIVTSGHMVPDWMKSG